MSNKTVYQGLMSTLGFNAGGFNADNNTKTIIKGDSDTDIRIKNIELQQRNFLKTKLLKVQKNSIQKAMQYEAHRLMAYIDYESMEYYPLIGSALNLFSEEATTIDSNGEMLHIFSEKERIKNELENLFHGVLSINTNLPHWTRNLVKYGDNFLYLYGEKDKGITYVKQLPNEHIERSEKIVDNKISIKFKNRGGGVLPELEIFEVAHFRILGDDKFYPYGSSVLNKIRRVFRQLILAEDAMITYRMLRASERRVFKIPVGTMNDDDIEAYMELVMNKFKKTSEVNPNNGNIDYRFQISGNDEDYFIPVKSENTGAIIDTLPGAQNIGELHDINYLRDNLFMGLEVPRPFLSYQSTGGDGKNLSQFDVRFSKKINKIQQALLLELNKMAIIHLRYLGYSEEDCKSFKLSLTNPSTQSEMLKLELLETKGRVYEMLTKTSEGSIAATSHTWAKKNVLGWTEREIIHDLKVQRFERAISQELQDTGLIIKRTGLFNDVDKKYGTDEVINLETGEGTPEPTKSPDTNVPEQNKFDTPEKLPPAEGIGSQAESKTKKIDKLITEFEDFLTDHVGDKKAIKSIIDDNKRLNENAFKMIESFDVNSSKFKINEMKNMNDSDEIYEYFQKMKYDQIDSQINDITSKLD